MIFVAGTFLSQPKSVNAQVGFGGFVTWTLPCTCSANFWLMMVPLYMPTPAVGALVYQPGATLLYANYAPVTGSWLLGNYIPGLQACYIIIPYGCMIIPSMGVMTQVGTSL